MKEIGHRLRTERIRLNLKLQTVAEVGGVLVNAQGQYEKGVRSPRGDYLIRIATLGVDVLYVVTGQKTPVVNEKLESAALELTAHLSQLSENDRALVFALVEALSKRE